MSRRSASSGRKRDPVVNGSEIPNLIDGLPDALVMVSCDGTILHVTSEFEHLAGYTAKELAGQPVEILIPDGLRASHEVSRTEYARHPIARTMAAALETKLLKADGALVPVEITLGVTERLGESPIFTAAVRDVTIRRLLQEERDRQTERLRTAFEANVTAMIIADLEDRIVEVNRAFCELLGYSRERLVGSVTRDFVHPHDLQHWEAVRYAAGPGADRLNYVRRYVTSDGRVVTAEVTREIERNKEGPPKYQVCYAKDISEQARLVAQMTHDAMHDRLTGLINRTLLLDRIERAQGRMVRDGGYCALLFLRIDSFQEVIDSLGHTAGDVLVVAVAKRLEKVAHRTDTLACLGGDQFIYLAPDLRAGEQTQSIAKRLHDCFAEPFSIRTQQLRLRASIGAVVCNGSDESAADILRYANIALRHAQRQGRHQTVFFSSSMEVDSTARFSIERDLPRAMQTGEISMYYQPIVDMATGEIRGLESLMRWHHPNHGLIPPNVFIPIAEEVGLMDMVGSRAIDESLAAAARWSREFEEEAPFVSVNLSASWFHNPGAIEYILKRIESTGAKPSRLVLELTEQAMFSQVAAAKEALLRLGSIGIRVALDDFGTGYSSLSHITELRPAIIKVDRSFVAGGRDDQRSIALLEAISWLAKRLDLTVIAEGVETAEQKDAIAKLDIQLGQGFLWSRAVDEEAATTLLRKGRAGGDAELGS